MAHGYAKLERGPEQFAATLHGMGIAAPLLMAWLVTLSELLGGALLMVGASTKRVCVPLAMMMVVAMVGVHWRYGFSSVKLRAFTGQGAEFGPVGYELNLLYLAALLVLALGPPLPLSVDAWLDERRPRRHASG